MKRRRLMEEPTAPAADRVDPLEDLKNLKSIGALFDLQRRFNVLDSESDWGDNSERLELLAKMKRTLKQGSVSYQNPFGGDDTEYFLDSFCELLKHEQKAFFKIAQSCTTQGGGAVLNFEEGFASPCIGRLITEEDLRQVLLAPVEPPFYVDPTKGSDEQSGSQRAPVASCDKAQELVEEYLKHRGLPCNSLDGKIAIKVTCRPESCRLLKCCEAGCPNQVCKTHGDGKGKYYSNNDLMVSYHHFQVGSCQWGDCDVAYCPRHTAKMGYCQVCKMNGDAQAHMIDQNCPEADLFSFCSQHLTRCMEKLEDEEDENGNTAECGFDCCPSCIDEHRCGYDPCDYI